MLLKGLLALVCAFALSSCGYQVGMVKPTALAKVKSIAVPTFENLTLEPRASVLVSNAVIKQMQMDGTYSLGALDNSDAVLHGKIKRLARRQARSARFDSLRTSELDFTLEVDYSLVDTKTGEVYEEGTIEGRTSQFLDFNFQLSERQALPLAAENVARSLVGEISEGW